MKLRDWVAYSLLKVPKQKVSPIAAALSEPAQFSYGPDWAQEKYGEYYATSVPVYAAVRTRADAVIRPPLKVYRLKAGVTKSALRAVWMKSAKLGVFKAEPDREELPEHPASQLLRKVNDFWTASDLWRATTTYLDLWGSAYWVLTKTGPSSQPVELWPARPDKMRVIPSKDRYIAGFEYQEQGQRIKLRTDEVVWLRHFNPLAELAGLSPMAPLRLSADMGKSALNYNAKAFKNGMLFGSVGFKAEGNITETQIEDFWKRLQKKFAGSDNAQRPLIYSAMEPKNLGFSARDMEYLGTMRWSLEDVSRVYGVPKAMLHHPDDPTYSNAKAQEQWFWRNTMVPLLLFLQERVNEMLLPQFGDPNLYAEFDLSQIEALQADVNEVAARQRADVSAGVLTVNEVRAERNLNPVPWGDSWWAPFSLMPISSGTSPVVAAPAEGKGLIPPLKVSDFQPDGWKRWTPPMLTEAVIDKVANAHSRRLGRFQQRFKSMQSELFSRQERDVLKRLREQGAKSIEKQGFGEPLFDPKEWIDLWERTGSSLYVASLVESADDQISLFGLGVSFDVNRPLVQDWLKNRVRFWASRVNDETGRLLMQELDEAAKAGESIRDIQARVEKVFRFNNSVRSEMVARTEMQAATNNGALEAYRQSGVVEQKQWIAAIDERTREAHLEAHQQTVPLEAPFLVGGEELMAPGEGSPANAINCRCSLVPVIAERSRSLPASIPVSKLA